MADFPQLSSVFSSSLSAQRLTVLYRSWSYFNLKSHFPLAKPIQKVELMQLTEDKTLLPRGTSWSCKKSETYYLGLCKLVSFAHCQTKTKTRQPYLRFLVISAEDLKQIIPLHLCSIILLQFHIISKDFLKLLTIKISGKRRRFDRTSVIIK